MSFLDREREKLNAILNTLPEGPVYDAVYAAQQALVWASDPDGFMSPSAQLHKYFGVGEEGTKGTGIVMLALGEKQSESERRPVN